MHPNRTPPYCTMGTELDFAHVQSRTQCVSSRSRLGDRGTIGLTGLLRAQWTAISREMRGILTPNRGATRCARATQGDASGHCAAICSKLGPTCLELLATTDELPITSRGARGLCRARPAAPAPSGHGGENPRLGVAGSRFCRCRLALLLNDAPLLPGFGRWIDRIFVLV
jgi:hypothetical protein